METQNFQQKVFRINWNTEKDIHLRFPKYDRVLSQSTTNQRKLSRIQGIFYDSLGLISPISLPIKFILQKLFELKINWDNRIDVETNNFGKNILTPKF